MEKIFAILLVTLGGVISAFAAFFLKTGSGKFELKIKSIIANWRVILGLFLYVLSTIPFLIALRGQDLSFLYPFVSMTYIFVTVVSLIMLKERMNIHKYIGVLLVVIGIVLIGLS